MHCDALSIDTDDTSLTKHRFSCIECPVELTVFKSLKRNSFEKHNLVPIGDKLQISDDAFGLKVTQLRRLSCDCEEDVILYATTN